MTVYENMPEAEYHAHPALSSTGVRRLLDSPARYRYWADHHQPGKQSFDVGSAAHTKILGVGSGTIVYPDEHLTPSGAVSTKAATVAWAEEQRAAGLIPITRTDAARVDAMAEAVLADREARAVIESITGREVSIITDVDGVPVRARFDMYDGVKGADLKTARDASPKGFNQSVGRYGYHVQEAWYSDAHKAETGRELEAFTFVVVEAAPPHLVGVYVLDWMWEDVAKAQTKRARDVFRACTESGVWPSYGRRELTPPTWAVYENEEEEIQV